MRKETEQLFVDTLRMIEETYQEYLDEHNCEDTPIFRAGYYLLAKEELKVEPLPNVMAQEIVIGKLDVMIQVAVKNAHNRFRASLQK